ncbi:MAG TPA: lipopolysaccharide biosynthesis protein [Blastocatellia bacterium]|nr:lipopolysaccharide biosynthesis protein [Blastocatellia bacterium]
MAVTETTKGSNNLTKRAAWLASARILAFAMTIPLPLVLVRTLNQSDFGLYKQVFQIMMTVLALSGLSVNMSVLYFLPRNPDKKPQIALNVLAFYGVVGSLVALFFAIFPGSVTLIFKGDGLVPHMPLLGIAILLWLLSTVLEVVAVADNDIRSASLFIVVIQLTKSALMMLAAVLFGSVHAVVVAAVLQGVLQCAIMFSYLHKRFGRFWTAFDWPLFKAQLANALPFGIGGLAYATQGDLHNYFVSHYFDPDQFAIYAVGCFQLPLLGMLLDSVISVLLPEVARREAAADYQGIIQLWAAAIRKLSLFFIPVYTLLFVVRHEFITVLFTHNYAAAAPIFAINLLNILLYICVPTSILRSFDELKFLRLKLSLAMIPLGAVALYVGIHAAGLVGAITAVVIVQTLDLAILVFAIARKLKMTPRDLRRFAPVLRTLAAASIGAAATYGVRLVVTGWSAFIALAVCSTVFVTVCLTAAFFTGALNASEKLEMRGTLLRFYRVGSKRLGLSTAEVEDQVA